uniref:Uncharacterized protein n=1 Tax=Meloidogyne enterolobii TaxID=390850 RepID=A0A6V7UM72_MELEN|nr:unnamed protein product [Meloidogyne enterolobii]
MKGSFWVILETEFLLRSKYIPNTMNILYTADSLGFSMEQILSRLRREKEY